jgi:PTH2 family peptidyl-tRNA hydrolase
MAKKASSKKITMQNTEYKQAIVIRSDLAMSIGKAAAQAAHASLESYLAADKKISKVWLSNGAKKIVLACSSVKQLEELRSKSKEGKLSCALIKDAGRTELPAGTPTALGIGPDDEKKIDKITGSLPLMV